MTYQQPDAKGFYGKFGGQFVPETLMTAVIELDKAYREAKEDPSFQAELDDLLKNYVGRETPLYHAKRLTDHIGGAQIYLKREDLNHTGAHKINNALGQVLLAKRMGKKKIIAETGAGQHGVATATAAALFDMDCTIYMGEEDVKRQALNVFRMELLGAKVFSVTDGSRVLKDAVNAALRAWVAGIEDTHYIMGSALGPAPFPEIVRDFQSVIGREAKRQYAEISGGKLPDAVMACIGGGSNAIGMFYPFVNDKSVAIMVLRLLVWGLILKNMPQPLPKAVQVSFTERLWMSSKMLMVKSWKPSLSQLVWTTQGLVLSTVISTKLAVRLTTLSQTKKLLKASNFCHVWKVLSQLLSLAMPLRLRKKWQLRCHQTKASSSASQVVGTRTLCRLKNVSKLKQKGNKP